ncbi:MAG: GNAT family N-acetyltransferase [Hyphomicrobiales bacterium]|nr:GNAT family N-acetyltransferase [Hyphomicrobiales bacterium]
MTTLIAPPYRNEAYDLGPVAGSTLRLEPMTADTAATIGNALATFGPWRHYATPAAILVEHLASTHGGTARYAARLDGVLAGAIVVRSPWLLGPYLQLLAVLPEFQGRKIGDRLLGWFEETAREDDARQVWLCVTGANTGAQRFYRAHGWQEAARLNDLIADGEDELMLRKWLIPRPT